MPYSEKSIENMKNTNESISNGISNYMLNSVRVDTQSIMPNDPSIKYQNSGIYRTTDSKFMDVNSELLNITRPLTNDVTGKFLGDKGVETDIQMGDFSSKYSRLDEPAFELRGKTKNRWFKLPIDPQSNSIEPFKRLGTNTHLTLVDLYEC